MAGNDLMALGCYDVLAARGMACPDDMSVVGFNDMPFSERFDPPLTTIGIPQYEIGAAAAELLLERLQDPDATAREVTLAPRLVVRGSTGAPPVPFGLTIAGETAATVHTFAAIVCRHA